VQQQALRDSAQAMANFFAGTHRRPTWRKAGVHEGFRIVGRRGRQWDVRRLSRKPGQVRIPKVVRVEDLKIKNMVRSAGGPVAAPGRNVRAKAGLNRAVRTAGWGQSVTRLEDEAPGRVEKIDPAFTSQICPARGHRAAESRESQAVFRRRACGPADHADVNAAKNIAAGRAVTARGALQPSGGAANREPQPVLSSA
jgi:transposase